MMVMIVDLACILWIQNTLIDDVNKKLDHLEKEG